MTRKARYPVICVTSVAEFPIAPSIYVPTTPRTPRIVKALPRVGEARPRGVGSTAQNNDPPHPMNDERFPPTPHSTALKRSKQIDRSSIEKDAIPDVASSSVKRWALPLASIYLRALTHRLSAGRQKPSTRSMRSIQMSTRSYIINLTRSSEAVKHGRGSMEPTVTAAAMYVSVL